MTKPNQRRGRGIPASCKLQPQLSPQKLATTASPKLLVTDAESNQAPPPLPLSAAVFRNLNYPAFHSMRIEQCHTFDMNGRLVTLDQTVLTCSKLIVPQAMTQVEVMTHLSKGSSGLEHKSTQFLPPFLSKVCHALALGVIRMEVSDWLFKYFNQ